MELWYYPTLGSPLLLHRLSYSTEHSHIGIVDSSVAPSLINMVIINGLVFMLPVLAYFLRRKVIAIIAPSIDGVSAAKGSQSRTFLNGLTIQVLMPFLLYVPVFFCQQFTFFTKIELLFQQYFIFVCPAMPTVVDPLISLYFVKPYRKQIKIWLNMERKEIPINQSPSVFIVV
ncbi:hypothetical protein GCK72_025419 [Caenorhabditis remanei]|uniref:Uncharacterized protein n=1 Tax=Caenorhabditis remanei TaxID=31234 RepID=A0A6A5G2P4_CAERE|nr:hypothetical protein GCK72_025419 [Caenorhabditis remanei]KAF1748952.1 hypothetical protein GCK72_025419 [Caenorhabditis remanei]